MDTDQSEMMAIRVSKASPGRSPAFEKAYGMPIRPAPRIELVKLIRAEANVRQLNFSNLRCSAVTRKREGAHCPVTILRREDDDEDEDVLNDERSVELVDRLALDDQYRPYIR